MSLRVCILVIAFCAIYVHDTHAETGVLCGGHRAANCAGCPHGHGRGWCNGECVWKNNACVSKSGYGPWKETKCSQTCGIGTKSRTRACELDVCTGATYKEQTCYGEQYKHADGSCSAWPKLEAGKCDTAMKQSSSYGRPVFQPALDNRHQLTSVDVTVRWDDLQYHPDSDYEDTDPGIYMAYTTGIKYGPKGYFGIQLKAVQKEWENAFLFSFWDEGRFRGTGDNKKPKAASKLAWPVDTVRCVRECQDCGLPDLVQFQREGFTTGTKCIVRYPEMKVGDAYRIVLKQIEKHGSVDTATHEGMGDVHKTRLNEQDKVVKGGIWEVKAYDLQRNNKEIIVGTLMFEGAGEGMYYLNTFDEHMGCNKCSMTQHADTRYNLSIGSSDGRIRKPIKMNGLVQPEGTKCKNYMITGKEEDHSITFQSGPFTKQKFPHDPRGPVYQPVW